MEILDPISTILSQKSPDLWTTEPDSTVYEAVKLMAERQIGALLVMKANSLAGLITEREYLRDVMLKGKSSKTTLVQEIMIKNPVCITPQDSAAHAMHLMTGKKVRHLPVVKDARLLGILSIGDLVKWIISAQDNLIHQLENYIKGTYPG